MTKTFTAADPLADHRAFQTRFLDGMLKVNGALGTATRQHGGTGLGPALCKLPLQAMAGCISVTSRPGQGSTFHFAIRLDVQPPPPGQSDPQPAQTEQPAIRGSPIGL